MKVPEGKERQHMTRIVDLGEKRETRAPERGKAWACHSAPWATPSQEPALHVFL